MLLMILCMSDHYWEYYIIICIQGDETYIYETIGYTAGILSALLYISATLPAIIKVVRVYTLLTKSYY